MTDPVIIAASYAAERNCSHNLDDVIDASDAVGAWGTTKESTSGLADLSGNGHVAAIKGPMPTEGFIQGRRFDGENDHLNLSSINLDNAYCISMLIFPTNTSNRSSLVGDNTTTRGYIFIGRDIDSKAIWFEPSSSEGKGGVFGSLANRPSINTWSYISIQIEPTIISYYKNGILIDSDTPTDGVIDLNLVNVGKGYTGISNAYAEAIIGITITHEKTFSLTEFQNQYNVFARLPFWSVNYTDYPNNTTEYTDNLPYSSSIISSGTFKVDDDKLQCVSAGTMTYSASYAFDGSEYIKVTIGGVEYAGTGTITQGNTTVSVAQGSNKVTIQAGTGDTIDEINIQFRAKV